MLTSAVICLVVAIADGDTLTARCETKDVQAAVFAPAQSSSMSPAILASRERVMRDDAPYRQIRVRLAGIDAPEKRQDYGQQARQTLSDLCFKQMAIITPHSQDRYGRLIADVQCKQQDAGSYMVRQGLAMVYERYTNTEQRKRLLPLQEAARRERLGQWRMLEQGQEPVAPWQWRRKR